MNWNKQLFFTFMIMLGLIFNSCKTNKTPSSIGFDNEFLIIRGLQCTETINPDAIDSQVGSIDCGTISFTYDYGKFSNSGPQTANEKFRETFDTYHHIKFFENRMIDPKVYKIFLDSVQVIDVRRKKSTDKLMMDCEPCNTTAEVTFKGDTYFYPLTMNEDQLSMSGSTVSFDEKGDNVYKYFQEENELPGLYITPKKNRYKNKNTLSLRVSKSALPTKEVNRILRTVELISK